MSAPKSSDMDESAELTPEQLAVLKAEQDAKRDEERGFTDADLEACAKVLEALKSGRADIHDKSLRRVRKAGSVLYDHYSKNMFGGKTLEEQMDKTVRRSLKRTNRQKLQQAEKRHVEEQRKKAEFADRMKRLMNPLTTPLLENSATSEESGAGDESSEVAATDFGVVETKTKSHACYICKMVYNKVHEFYASLCPPCASLNYTKRLQTANLHGYVALLTGGRVKIGFQTGLKLLRAGAFLVVTTRFPKDAALRYAKEEDYESWSDRLRIYGLDLRDLIAVEQFCAHLLDTLDHLDVIVSNAAQTVRRPVSYYAHLLPTEAASLDRLPEPARKVVAAVPVGDSKQRHIVAGEQDSGAVSTTAAAASTVRTSVIDGLHRSAAMSQIPMVDEDFADASETQRLFPEGQLDVANDNQQLDLRDHHSWKFRLHEVPTPELVETMSINAFSPFVLNARLKPLMTRSHATRPKFIVNVSAMEGKFYRFKTINHPHTNMAKAALNMLTRTSGADYAKNNIFMTCVDTGWITDENPHSITERKKDDGFESPIDEVDAAARILDPVFDGVNGGELRFGVFMKDYTETEW